MPAEPVVGTVTKAGGAPPPAFGQTPFGGTSLAEPDPKRLRGPDESLDPAAAAVLQQAGASLDDQAWSDQWAEVFTLMQEGDMEARAAEYAEAVVALKKNAESLQRQRNTIQASCEQLLHTAYREALQAHLKAMLEAASAGATQDIVDAARKTVDELCPAELPSVQQAGPAWMAKQPGMVKVGIGLPQPGVMLPPGKAVGLLGLPPKPPPPAQVPSAVGKGVPASGSQPSFSQIGQFAAAAAAAQQEAAAAHTVLWVGGLPEGIDEAMFRTLFSRYGSIISVKLVGDKGFGFVRYSKKEEAQAAIGALDNFECNGVKLSVRHAEAPGGLGAPPPAVLGLLTPQQQLLQS